ncbi:MAG TPA: Gfo/Idh/MocA family oxidoreductase [Polyangiales bacterium]|nr:Gfo/Idh/MocA family oxidoreductase [Polyangiales bacterium]
MIRLGLIGAGAWGKRYAETIGRQRGCKLVAVARGTPRPGEPVFGLPVAASWRELIARAQGGELDGLIVATTPEHQAEVVAACIESTLPVLAEKPLGLKRAVSSHLLARWFSVPQRAPVLIDYVQLWAPAFVELQRMVQARGGAEAVRSVVAQGGSLGPFRGWSSLYDYGSHDLAMLARLLGIAPLELETVQRLTSADPRGEWVRFGLRWGETEVSLTLGNGAPEKRRQFQVTLSNDTVLEYDDLRAHPNKLTLNGQAVPVATTLPLDLVVTEFAERVRRFRVSQLAEEPGESGLRLCGEVSARLDLLAERASLAK